MGMKLGEIFVEFGIKGAEKMKDFAKDLGSIPLNVAGTAAAFGGLSLTFAGFVDDMMNMTTGLREFGAQTGYATEALDKWDQVARHVGLSNATVESSFMSLTRKMAALKAGQGDENMIMAFGQLGISSRDYWNASPDKIMALLRSKYQTASRNPADLQKFMTWLPMTGISSDMALAFQSSLSSPKHMAGMDAMYSPSAQKEIAQFIASIGEVTDVFRRDFLDFFKEIEPHLPMIAKGLEDLAKVFSLSLAHAFELIDLGKKVWNTPGFLSGLVDQMTPNVSTRSDLREPHKVTINHHFYGSVDKDDLADSDDVAQSTWTRTARMIGKEPQ